MLSFKERHRKLNRILAVATTVPGSPVPFMGLENQSPCTRHQSE